jgi:Fur family transcriptional regulator, zinc uptake regulator
MAANSTQSHSHHGHDHNGHDHHRHAATPEEALNAAAKTCEKQGLRLTDQRRDVMLALAEAGKPLGAYDILSILTLKGYKKLAPVSVYRALDFLLDAGLVHRLESRNAFILCPHQHGANETVIFLICESCGRVEEALSEEVKGTLSRIASHHHFALKGQVIEMKGQCAVCISQPMVA